MSKKALDNPLGSPYPTPSMSSLLSPEMLESETGGHPLWSERGDSQNAGQEEGFEEEVEEALGAPRRKRGHRAPEVLSFVS